MNRIINKRNASFFLGLIGAIATIQNYATHQSALWAIILVFIGCWLFWTWIASLVISILDWLQTEILLMGRAPRIQAMSTFDVAKWTARIIGLAIPFAFSYPQEGTAALLNPERWALVPITMYVCLGLVAIPIWLALKYGASKLMGTES